MMLKNSYLYVLLLFGFVCNAQVQIHNNHSPIQVEVAENNELLISVSKKDIDKFKTKGFISYSDFGAKGDGKTDDIVAISAAHEIANKYGLAVKADEDVTYYIGGVKRFATIQTNTDFGTAAFIINDTNVEDLRTPVFKVASSLERFAVTGVFKLKKYQKKLKASWPSACLVTVVDSTTRRYIRYGLNQNNGSPQTDIFMVDKNGKVAKDTPIIWDFDQITQITALPIDTDILTITGGKFTTIANQAESKYNYYSRGLAIRRSNVLVDGIQHLVMGEGEQGAPYMGFIDISDAANVTVQNAILTGRKTYQTIGAVGKPVSMGSYDIRVSRGLNVSFINCTQSNDIDDATYWGIMASNFSKNLLYDNCALSRFDAHMGVFNATIRNSTLGHMGINVIGSGTFIVDNATIRGSNMVNLRSDYGSTWQGEFIIKNSIFMPKGGKSASASLINGAYSGQHNFGYTCYMPERITIENLHIDDSNHPDGYKGVTIFADFNKEMTDTSYVEKYPYVKTKKVVLKNVTTASGKEVGLSENSIMFEEVHVKRD